MNYTHKLKNPIFKTIQVIADELNYPTFVVGGWVRDLLLNRIKEKTDIDFVCVGNGIKLAEKVSLKIGNKAKFTVYKNFGTAMIQYNNESYEFVGARKESYRQTSRKPIIENGTLEDDQKRRDFTINAMYIQLNSSNYGELIDPFNGLQDLKNKIIKTPLNPENIFCSSEIFLLSVSKFVSAKLGPFAIRKTRLPL